LARLAPDLVAKDGAASKVEAARTLAARLRCTVLLKGPDTVIAAPDGACAISAAFGADAAPWLATAGAGDVLAGMIAGLLARGMPPPSAAESAACLHLSCARASGPGLIAEDLPEALPAVLRSLD
jgi:NAD(P)H-hydrate repair Nnr-like enzyme with NAD(P)H-hydrate dehydratase domain